MLPKLRNRSGRSVLLSLTGGLSLAIFPSCQTVGLLEAGRLRQPNMQFEEDGPFSYDAPLLSQIQTGRSASGGATGGGCSSCR